MVAKQYNGNNFIPVCSVGTFGLKRQDLYT